MNHLLTSILLILHLETASAQMNHDISEVPMSPADCSGMLVWDYETGSCAPMAMAQMPMRNWMIHGNLFLSQSFQEGPRGRNQFSAPNMLMGDIGSSIGDIQYINVNLMLTLEKWTFPSSGHPELLQIGEHDSSGRPYIDAQHPHSSPIMGLTLSDTVSLGGRDHLKIFFAPRGQATEGPIAFMHRSTGMYNPDAPLGHHIGQDVAHISSTVFGVSINSFKATLEGSVYNGTEPGPDKTDLPLGKLNSHAYRFIYEFSDFFYAMASAAFVKDPEKNVVDIDHVNRYSASLYFDKSFQEGFMFHNTFIFGMTNFYDHISKLRSFGEEFLFHQKDFPHQMWGRIELLERSASELAIAGIDELHWVSAVTVGYTYEIKKTELGKMGIGISITKDFIPSVFEAAYGADPLSAKVFLQLNGMKMGNLF